MKGKIIDKNLTDAYVTFHNGDTLLVSLSTLPKGVKVGDSVDINWGSNSITNDKLADFF